MFSFNNLYHITLTHMKLIDVIVLLLKLEKKQKLKINSLMSNVEVVIHLKEKIITETARLEGGMIMGNLLSYYC